MKRLYEDLYTLAALIIHAYESQEKGGHFLSELMIAIVL